MLLPLQRSASRHRRGTLVLDYYGFYYACYWRPTIASCRILSRMFHKGASHSDLAQLVGLDKADCLALAKGHVVNAATATAALSRALHRDP